MALEAYPRYSQLAWCLQHNAEQQARLQAQRQAQLEVRAALEHAALRLHL